ncbi:hypothetical protein vseg_014010 [Gypsophila vaccaria]
MATIIASSSASLVACATLVSKRAGVSFSPLGLPAIGKKGKVVCSVEVPPKKVSSLNVGMVGSLAAAAAAATMSNPAMGLVDERMSTEGTGLPFGLSNNLLGWILLGVFGLIWSVYFVYTSGLDEDEDSGLSL